MAKKPEENELVKTVVSIASGYVFESIFGKINEEFRLVLDNIEKKGYQIEEHMLERLGAEFRVVLDDVEKKGYRMQERMLEKLFSFLTLSVACIFIVLGVYSVLRDYLGMTSSEAYLIVGAALLAAYFLMSRKQRFGNES